MDIDIGADIAVLSEASAVAARWGTFEGHSSNKAGSAYYVQSRVGALQDAAAAALAAGPTDPGDWRSGAIAVALDLARAGNLGEVGVTTANGIPNSLLRDEDFAQFDRGRLVRLRAQLIQLADPGDPLTEPLNDLLLEHTTGDSVAALPLYAAHGPFADMFAYEYLVLTVLTRLADRWDVR